MDLDLTPQALAFREELCTWLSTNMTRPWREVLRDPAATEDSLVEHRRAWQRKHYQAGYLGMDWPPEWGGRGATEVEKSIFEAELARADAPPILNILGIGLLGPALIHHGSKAQRRRLHPADALRRRDLVSGLQRAGRRQRSRVAQDGRRPRRRPLRPERPEGVDTFRAMAREATAP